MINGYSVSFMYEKSDLMHFVYQPRFHMINLFFNRTKYRARVNMNCYLIMYKNIFNKIYT